MKTHSIRSIGAISHARWMAKVICELHIALFSTQLIQFGILDETEAEKHRYLALFLMLFYIPIWIECPLPFEAPRLDLQLYQSLLTLGGKTTLPTYFKDFVPVMINRMAAHMWYLSESLVFLVLFSTKVSDFEKEKCRKAMLKYKEASKTSLKKLGKLITPVNVTSSTKLHQLFGPDSWLIPVKMSANVDFLEVPAKNWENEPSFIVLREMLKDIQVTNDAAERSILLAKTLHNKLTYKKKKKSALYQTIPELRRIIPNCNKSTLLNTDLSSLV